MEAEKQEEQTNELVKNQKKPVLFGWKAVCIALVALILIVFANTRSQDTPKELSSSDAPAPRFDQRLLACNELLNAEPTEAFSTCLEAAEDGAVAAKEKLVWAYARDGEYQNWQEVFNWLYRIKHRDEETQLLLFAILHLMGDTTELKQKSEEGISRLVNKNHAPSKVFLASLYALGSNQLPKTSRPIWLLSRAYKKQPELVAPSMLATIYAEGWLSDPNLELATQILKEGASKNYPTITNNVAWFLSTIDSNLFTSKQYPIELAKSVTDNPEHASNPIYVDTLAATYAANNLFEKAITTQTQAILLLEQSDINESRKNRQLEEFKLRLEMYEGNQAFVEENIYADKIRTFTNLRNLVIEHLFAKLRAPIEAPVVAKNEQ